MQLNHLRIPILSRLIPFIQLIVMTCTVILLLLHYNNHTHTKLIAIKTKQICILLLLLLDKVHPSILLSPQCKIIIWINKNKQNYGKISLSKLRIHLICQVDALLKIIVSLLFILLMIRLPIIAINYSKIKQSILIRSSPLLKIYWTLS